jgi:hypothetical protein
MFHRVFDVFRYWFSGTLSFDVFELVSKKTKDLRQFYSGMGGQPPKPPGFCALFPKACAGQWVGGEGCIPILRTEC